MISIYLLSKINLTLTMQGFKSLQGGQKMKITKLQQLSLKIQFKRQQKIKNYLTFRRTISKMIGGEGAIIVKSNNMFIAIETDGYMHT